MAWSFCQNGAHNNVEPWCNAAFLYANAKTLSTTPLQYIQYVSKGILNRLFYIVHADDVTQSEQ